MKKILSLVFVFIILFSSVHISTSFAREGETGSHNAINVSKPFDLAVQKQVALPNGYTEEEIMKIEEKYGLGKTETVIEK